MNVTDKWMLERMQQMAANMANSLPQVGQQTETPKTDKGESFKDLMNKAKDQQTEAPAKDTPVKKTETVQDRAPAQKTEHKVITDMKDPRIQALDPATQAQIAAGFLTPVELSDGSILMRIDAQPSAVVMPCLPDGQPDWSKPMVLVNSNGEEFEFYFDQENGNHKLFQVMDSGVKEQIDLFPEQPKFDLLDNMKSQDVKVIDSEGKVATLREAISRVRTKEDAGESEDNTQLADGGEATEAKPLFHDVETAPVKVGENFQLDTEQPDMDANLANTIRMAAEQGWKQVEIKLCPENLGSMTIKLTQNSDGILQVVLHTSNSKAASLLTQHMSDLNAALQGYNQGEVRVEVQHNENSQQAGQQQQQQTDPDGHNRQSQQQQQQRQQDNGNSGDFLQKLRLGLFSLEDFV